MEESAKKGINHDGNFSASKILKSFKESVR